MPLLLRLSWKITVSNRVEVVSNEHKIADKLIQKPRNCVNTNKKAMEGETSKYLDINQTDNPKPLMVIEITDFTTKLANECNKNFTVTIAGIWTKLFAESLRVKTKIIDYLKDKISNFILLWPHFK